MISIVMPVYNEGIAINSAIKSVLSQDYPHFELIIVDDGSTDDSADIAGSYNDPRIRIIRQPNRGVSAARNTGIRAAIGEFIAFLDSDDHWDPDYLSTQTDLILRYRDCSVFTVGYRLCADGKDAHNVKLRRLPYKSDDGILNNYFEVASCSHPPIWTSSVIIRREAIVACGLFDERIKLGEDLLLWAKLANKYPIAHSRLIKASYNIKQGNHSIDNNDIVGDELKAMYMSNKNRGLRQYIGHWHKMRARIAITGHHRLISCKESLKSMGWNLTVKAAAMLIICILPYTISEKILR